MESLGVVIDLQQCSIEDSPAKISVNESVSINVILKDTKGRPICNASKAITVKVTLPLIDDDSSVRSIILDMENGKYSVIFTPMKYINHVVSIQINGNHISGSPVELEYSFLTYTDSLRSTAVPFSATSDTLSTTNAIKLSRPHSRSRTSEAKHHYTPAQLYGSSDRPKHYSYS